MKFHGHITLAQKTTNIYSAKKNKFRIETPTYLTPLKDNPNFYVEWLNTK
jgi:hypothetical protein